jgi:hypothetical protein
MRLDRKFRDRGHYTIEAAGAMRGWSRSTSYRLAAAGDIPVERITLKLLGVPKRKWDQKLQKLRKGKPSRPHKAKTTCAAEIAATP